VCSPVNSYVLPIGGATPGYESEVVFADGSFVEGSTSELSADGPLREPYVAFCQVRPLDPLGPPLDPL
jgi:cystathionine beta-lyase family protein involved in aluminum resistance